MLLLLLPQLPWDGSSEAGYDLSLLVNTVLSRLGASGWADLDWLTETEVYAYFDEAAKRLATHCGAFVDRDASAELAAAVPQYANPDGWISTIHVSAGNTPQRLRPTSVAELMALDSAWQTTACIGNTLPTRYSLDAGPLGTVTAYPMPLERQAGQPLAHIYHRFPEDISSTQTLVPAPTPVADYFLYFALMRARGKESPGAMPEIAAAAKARVEMYEQIFQSYYGDGE